MRYAISVGSNEHKYTQYVRDVERNEEGKVKRVWLTKDFENVHVFGVSESYFEETVSEIENWINKLGEDAEAKCGKIPVKIERIN